MVHSQSSSCLTKQHGWCSWSSLSWTSVLHLASGTPLPLACSPLSLAALSQPLLLVLALLTASNPWSISGSDFRPLSFTICLIPWWCLLTPMVPAFPEPQTRTFTYLLHSSRWPSNKHLKLQFKSNSWSPSNRWTNSSTAHLIFFSSPSSSVLKPILCVQYKLSHRLYLPNMFQVGQRLTTSITPPMQSAILHWLCSSFLTNLQSLSCPP